MLNLNTHRESYEKWGEEERRSTAELAPWLFLYGDKLTVNKDSALMATYSLTGIDIESQQNWQVNQHTQVLQDVLSGNPNWPPTYWWTVHRRREDAWPIANFRNPVAAAFDSHLAAQQRRAGNNFVNRHYMSVLGPAAANSLAWADKLGHYMAKGHSLQRALIEALKTQYLQNRSFAYAAGELDAAAERFEEQLKTSLAALDELGLSRLQRGQILAFLHDCASVTESGQSSLSIPYNSFLDAWLGDSILEPYGNQLRIHGWREKYVAAISIKEWPKKPNGTRPRMLERLLKVRAEMTLSLIYRQFSRKEALKAIERRKTYYDITSFKWGAYAQAMLKKEKGMEGAQRNESKVEGAHELQRLIKELDSDKISWGAANLTVLVHGNTEAELNDSVDLVLTELRAAKLTPVREALGLTSAFAGTLPGQWAEPTRWVEMSSEQVADLAPIHSVRQGSKVNTFLTEQLGRLCEALVQFTTEHNTFFNFNFHVGDKAHCLVIGPTRGGKTVLINALLMLFARYGLVRIIRFDRDKSCRIPTILSGGRWIDSQGGKTRVNPLALLADPRHDAYLQQFIERLATAFGYPYDADDAKMVNSALQSTRALGRTRWRLQTLHSHITRAPLKNALEPWITGGAYGGIFDNLESDATDLFANPNLCIEMGGLLVAPRAAELYTDLILYQLEDTLNHQSGDQLMPTFVYLEEAGDLLRQPWFAQKADRLLKRLGKKLCGIILTVQSPEDGINNPIIKASLRDNIANYILLPNKNAQSPSLKSLYMSELNLNEQQINQICKAIPKQQYLIVQEGISRLINTAFDPWAVAHLRSDKLAQSLFDQHWQNGNGVDGWENNYLDAAVAAGMPPEEEDDE